jgi:hypothetical protein
MQKEEVMPQDEKFRINGTNGSQNWDAEVQNLFDDSRFYIPERTITDEILRLNEEMNKDYVAREFSEVFGRRKAIENGNGARSGPLKPPKLSKNDSWHKRALAGFSKLLLHRDDEPEISDDDFGDFFQKDVAERIFAHLELIAIAGYEEGDEPRSIHDLFTRRLVSNLGLKLIRSEKTPGSLKARAREVLLLLAWDFQCWLLRLDGQYPALFGMIYTRPPERLPKTGRVLVLKADVIDPFPRDLDADLDLVIGLINAHVPQTSYLRDVGRPGMPAEEMSPDVMSRLAPPHSSEDTIRIGRESAGRPIRMNFMKAETRAPGETNGTNGTNRTNGTKGTNGANGTGTTHTKVDT